MAGLDECQRLCARSEELISVQIPSTGWFFYDPIKHFSMKKSKNKV